MGATSIPANLIPKVWERRLWVEALKKTFFNKFAGPEVPTGDKTSKNSLTDIVHISTELGKKKGDTITFGLAYQMTGEGRTGSQQMEDYEEAISTYDQSVAVGRIRNAVLWDDIVEGQNSEYNMRNTAKTLLSDWLANRIETLTITKLTTSPTSDRILYGGDALADNEIDSSDVFSTALISAAVRKAENSTPLIRPVIVDGEPYYVILAHPWQILSMKSEPAWQEAQREANVRGSKNPIFSGAAGIWDGAVIHKYPRIPTYSTWGGGSVPGARAVLLGAQAVLWAFAKKAYWKERSKDYDSIGVQVGSLLGIEKAKFNSKDYGVIALDTYAAETYPSAIS